MINTVEKVYNPISNKFSMYKVTYNNNKIIFVPLTEENRHYQEIQEWAKIEGNNIIDPGA